MTWVGVLAEMADTEMADTEMADREMADREMLDTAGEQAWSGGMQRVEEGGPIVSSDDRDHPQSATLAAAMLGVELCCCVAMLLDVDNGVWRWQW